MVRSFKIYGKDQKQHKHLGKVLTRACKTMVLNDKRWEEYKCDHLVKQIRKGKKLTVFYEKMRTLEPAEFCRLGLNVCDSGVSPTNMVCATYNPLYLGIVRTFCGRHALSQTGPGWPVAVDRGASPMCTLFFVARAVSREAGSPQ